MAKLLQEHSKPIAQGIASSAIFQLMWNGGSAMIGWLAGHYAALGGIKPHWAILMGTTVFFLLAAIYYFLFRRPQVNETGREAGREAGRQAYEKADEQVVLLQKQLKAARDHAKRIAEFPCPDKWLHEIAKSDAEQLQIMVRVVKIVCKNEMRTKVLSYYYFHFVIENWTVYPLEIDRDISGSISFLGHNFKHKPEITQGSKLLCGPRSETIFTIQQQLEYPQEVEHIEKGPDTEDFMFTGSLKAWERVVYTEPGGDIRLNFAKRLLLSKRINYNAEKKTLLIRKIEIPESALM